MKPDRTTLAAILLWFALALSAAPALAAISWLDDIEVALERAAQQKRDVILVFRGPSTNPICRQMNDEVLDGLEFRTVIGAEFILCHALALEDQGSEELRKEEYMALSKRFHVAAYPILLLMDSQGHVYGTATIPKSTTVDLIRSITELRPRRAIMKTLIKAAKAAEQGNPTQVRTLSEALKGLGARFAMTHYPELVAQVIELDPSNEQGLKDFWEQQLSARELFKFNQIYAAIAPILWNKNSPEEMIELLDSTIEANSMQGDLLQLMEIQKYRVWAKEKNLEKMLEAARAANAVAPNSRLAERIQRMIKDAEEKLATPEPKKTPAAEGGAPASQTPAADESDEPSGVVPREKVGDE